MLPLALILKNLGHRVSGSDRGRDQGRTPEKFADLEARGITLYPQDGSGVCGGVDVLVVSAAVEDDVPDVAAARATGIPVMRRAALLAELFNAYPRRVAIGGTSGKTTVTGMVGFILKECGQDPVLMCGGVLKNYGAAALNGAGDVFVTECDESDGSIALFNPDVAVLTNVSVDHKSLEELRGLFGDFAARARVVAINADNAEAMALRGGNAVTFGLGEGADLRASDVFYMEEGVSCIVHAGGKRAALSLELQGAHNLSNALAAIAASVACGVTLSDACACLGRFTGIKRRMEWVGEAAGVTVIDDFAHNPDKISASLSALKAFEGRLIVMFQMHGYGPLKLMGPQIARSFAALLGPEDLVYMCDPLYLGGTADQSVGIASVVEAIGDRAVYHPTRESCAEDIARIARPGDRVVVMGARDDTLSAYAQDLLRMILEEESGA